MRQGLMANERERMRKRERERDLAMSLGISLVELVEALVLLSSQTHT